jgi:hypothetical protein
MVISKMKNGDHTTPWVKTPAVTIVTNDHCITYFSTHNSQATQTMFAF